MKNIIIIIALLVALVVGVALFGAADIAKEIGEGKDISVSEAVSGIRDAIKNSNFYTDISEMKKSSEVSPLADCLPADSRDIGVLKMESKDNSNGISGAFECNNCSVEGREKVSFEQSKYNMGEYIKQENISPEDAVLYTCNGFEILIDNKDKSGTIVKLPR